MKKITLFILISAFFCSCRTNLLTISVQSPAPVTISNSVKRVGIANRSIPEKDKLNTIHQALSFENMKMIQEGSAESVRGLKDALQENNAFEKVQFLDTLKLTTPGGGMFPAPLSWDKIETICKQNDVDALFVLEVFDTELKLSTLPTVPTNISNPMQVVNAIQQADLNTTVKTGWRIYDPRIRTVLDEFPLTQTMTSRVSGNPAAAVEAMVGRKEAVKQVANKAGHIYANRILPHWFRARRDYFIRGGSHDFKIAKRKARAGNWNGAAELWQKGTTSNKRKTAGRSYYNLAIINEINGNLNEALKLAQKSYEDYGNRFALKYIRILKARKAQENLLEIQRTE